jgi:hypothetical protein
VHRQLEYGGQYEAEVAVTQNSMTSRGRNVLELSPECARTSSASSATGGLNITLKRVEADPEWIDRILAAVKPNWVSPERADAPALDSAPNLDARRTDAELAAPR